MKHILTLGGVSDERLMRVGMNMIAAARKLGLPDPSGSIGYSVRKDAKYGYSLEVWGNDRAAVVLDYVTVQMVAAITK